MTTMSYFVIISAIIMHSISVTHGKLEEPHIERLRESKNSVLYMRTTPAHAIPYIYRHDGRLAWVSLRFHSHHASQHTLPRKNTHDCSQITTVFKKMPFVQSQCICTAVLSFRVTLADPCLMLKSINLTLCAFL